MSTEFDPNDLRSMMDYVDKTEIGTNEDELDESEVLLKFVENCIFLESQSHHWHLQCDNYAKHMELNELYEELPEHVDSFIEGLMESRGPIQVTGTTYVFQELEFAIEVLSEFIEHCTKVHEILESIEEYGSVNNLEDIMSFVDSILYKLKVLN